MYGIVPLLTSRLGRSHRRGSWGRGRDFELPISGLFGEVEVSSMTDWVSPM